MDYSSLKSGTDIRGVATNLGGRNVDLTEQAVYDISAAFALWLSKRINKCGNELKIAVGHDSRITADVISSKVKSALTAGGVNVLDCGLCSTPAMFMTTVDLGTDGAIQITASHHPFDRNGLKFFVKEGGLDGKEISEILELASNGECLEEASSIVKTVDYMKDYAARLRKMICDSCGATQNDKPLSGYHIVVDAGNGVGGFYATDVLAPLGADISGSQFLEPDGNFPNHIPNPENAEAMASICKAVTDSNADLGLIFDTDVDRAGCVGADGKEINRNRLIALASYIALQGNDGATVVTDSVTSDGLKVFIENDLGSTHYRYRRGYKNVIDKARELCEEGINCPLAIETSGHAALRENYFLDDGAYLVTKIVIELAKGNDIEKIIKPLELPMEERECRLNITVPNFRTHGERIIDVFTDFCEQHPDFKVADDNREGVRVSTPNGWFLLRLSVHDPVMPMNFESRVKGGIDKDIEAVLPFLKGFEGLDVSSLC
ncbi:MAG: phosphomannomutase/phosphoglucomutase [Ruminococcaceae bacterium]|nr:phosphomannomutase/phosphoglucomutase [Oscillospiraceae bacterium]